VLTCAAPCVSAPCRDAQHEIYAIVRNAMEIIESCGLERELRREAVRKLRTDGGSDAEVIAEFEDGWLLTDAAWARCAGDATALATKVKADEEGRVVEVTLSSCKGMKELPASVGRLQALTMLNLAGCRGLASLPAELGGLQALEKLDLQSCSGLTSLPDLSGLETLKVEHLPANLKLWEEGGRKAFAMDKLIAQSEDGWLLGDEEWAQCAGSAAELLSKLTPNKEGRVVVVDLGYCKDMKELPASVGRLQALTKLSLYGCSGLTSLPAELGGLQELKDLMLRGCTGLTSLPAELGGLQALTKLELNLCKGLTSLPAELGGLQELEDLGLYCCEGLTSLPDLSGLEKLEVKNLPAQLKPWQEGGRKAFALG